MTGALRSLPKVPWQDVEPFFLWRYRSTVAAAYRFLPGRRPAGDIFATMNRAVAGNLDGVVSSLFGVPAETMLAILNEYRARTLASLGPDREHTAPTGPAADRA
jgi:hypothetical protein